MVKVVNLRGCLNWGKPGDVLIDRRTKWGNPYKMYNESQRDEVCDKYELWLDNQLELGVLHLEELKSAKRLGCYCAPKRCHGDYIKKLLEKQNIQQSLNL